MKVDYNQADPFQLAHIETLPTGKTSRMGRFCNRIKKNSDEIEFKLPKRICGNIHRDWGKGLITQEHAFVKMEKNLRKALDEHITKFIKESLSHCDEKDLNPYVNLRKPVIEEMDEKSSDDTSMVNNFHKTPSYENAKFILKIGHASAQGPRPTMEDAHFCLPIKSGTVVGVLDGHGGDGVAIFASQRIQKLFAKILKKNKNNVHQTFEEMFLKIQAEIIRDSKFVQMGSTAVIAYIEKETNLIYTATLGDSEANIYKTEDHFKSTPLSCVRNWASPKDEARANLATGVKDYTTPLVSSWKDNALTPKNRRVDKQQLAPLKHCFGGVNVSRAFGDRVYTLGRPFDVVIAKPKILCCPLAPGVLVLACDGLKDYVKEGKIVNCIEHSFNETSIQISQNLVELAKLNETKDNVTVLTVKIELS